MGLFGSEDRAAAGARISEFSRFLTPLYTEGDVHLYQIAGFP
jgi:hypothetical protein